jgi:methanogenic corrinoid protein MtbC1
VIRLIEASADQAVVFVAEQLLHHEDGALAASDPLSRIKARRVIYEHLDFLIATLATDEPRLFEDYLVWLADVMSARGLGTETLSTSLRLLMEFFERRLDPVALAPVSWALLLGLTVLDGLRTSKRSVPQITLTPLPLPYTDQLTRTLIKGDIGTTRALIKRAQSEGSGYLHIATRLFQPSLYDVGRLWQQNKITVAQEHLASTLAQTILSQLFIRANFALASGRKALFACVAGNTHALGLRIVCDAFELSGWSVQFLGADVPGDALLLQVDSWRPDVVCLSAAFVQQLPELRRVITEIRRTFLTHRPTVIVGGLATNEVKNIWRWLGADEWFPDAEKAIAATGCWWAT